MAAEAEAAREARAKVIAAEGEHHASRSLAHAAEIIADTIESAAEKFHHIRYEDLVRQPDTVQNDLINRMGFLKPMGSFC